MKTIFYKQSDTDNADYWFGVSPYKEWFVLENTLYDMNGDVRKYTVIKSYIKNVAVVVCEDLFTDNGIERKIALYISK